MFSVILVNSFVTMIFETRNMHKSQSVVINSSKTPTTKIPHFPYSCCACCEVIVETPQLTCTIKNM